MDVADPDKFDVHVTSYVDGAHRPPNSAAESVDFGQRILACYDKHPNEAKQPGLSHADGRGAGRRTGRSSGVRKPSAGRNTAKIPHVWRGTRMTVPLLFALVGSVILVGFLANLLFRVTKIPSVLLLVGLGVVLGPVTGLIRTDALLAIAPFFGAAALLVILFEGGLELEIVHVVRHAPRTALLAAVVFCLSLAGVAALAHLFLGFFPLITR